MKWGGLFSYSKFQILQLLPKEHLPIQLSISTDQSSEEAFFACRQKGINFPLIIKPDKGERGKAVAYIQNEKAFHSYPYWQRDDIIIQEYIDWPLELGVFWIRNMKTNIGFVSSLMERNLLQVKGNGEDDIYHLLLHNRRYNRYAEKVKSIYPKKSKEVPSKGKSIVIEPIGNHSRGTTFLNAMDQLDEKITSSMNSLLMPIEGFNYGRLDIRTKSWEDLKSGKNYKILEVNGANSEPAHIYHPNSSIIQAYKSLFQHWNYIYEIAIFNQGEGMQSESLGQLYKAFKTYLKKDQ